MKKKLASFVVDYRQMILVVMMLLAILSIFLMQKVGINEDMTKYLPDDSAMKQGMDIMTEDFSDSETSQTIRVMFDDLSKTDKENVLKELQAIEYVDSVDYEEDSADYNIDNHTLFVINSSYEYDSKEMSSIEEALDNNFSGYTMVWNNDDTGFSDIPTWIILLAVGILMVILFIMCGSWIEPILFLIGIGFAVVINRGTNIFLGNVSNITASISSILQLVLSMDYSIILINRYKQEKHNYSDNKDAMKAAVEHAFTSIVSSAMTTVCGLLVLVFMRFKIGMDLGIVLAKGVFLSMFCVLILMPGIFLFCDKLIQKTAKKEPHIPMNRAGKFSYKCRFVISGVFIVLMVVAYIMQQQTDIVYTLEKEDKVAEVFPSDNTIVLVYETIDEDSISEIAQSIDANENVKSVKSYGTMLATPYTAEELANVISQMSDEMQIDKTELAMFYYDYYAGDEALTMTVSELFKFLSDDVAKSELFSQYMDEEMIASIENMEQFANAEQLTTPMPASQLAAFFGMDESKVNQLIYSYYNIQNLDGTDVQMSVKEFVNFLTTYILTNEAYASQFDEATSGTLMMVQNLINMILSEEEYSAEQMCGLLSNMGVEIDSNSLELLYLYNAGINHSDEEWKMTTEEFLNYLVDTVLEDERFKGLLDEDTKTTLTQAQVSLSEGKKQLVTDDYSRMIITTAYPAESEETFSFIENLESLCDDKLTGNFYLIGNSVMNYEMSQTFDDELLFITILTAVVIYIIVAISTKSLIIPLILVLMVQTGVYTTISSIGLQGNDIYYLALLIVQCILMGATIDYGILFTNYYVENRRKLSVPEALKKAYEGAIPTIATSGLILVLVTAIVGKGFSEPTVSAIVETISTGSFTAIILILFVLPGVLACCDKLVVRKN